MGGETGIAVERLSKARSGFTLKEVSFSLPQGYILGVIGRNGSGKSTLLETLLGGNFDRKDSGAKDTASDSAGRDGAASGMIGSGTSCHAGTAASVRVADYLFRGEEERLTDYRRQFAFVMEDCMLPENLNALDIAELFGKMYDGFDKGKYRGLLKTLELPCKRPVSKLSKGMKIKLQMAFAFSYSSRVLLLDEPSANLDTFARKELYRLIFEYMEDGTRNVLWTTHLTEELDRMADYLLLLEKGRQLFFKEKEEALSEYTVVKGSRHQLDCMKSRLLSRADYETYSVGLAKTAEGPFPLADTAERPTVEQLLLYLVHRKISF